LRGDEEDRKGTGEVYTAEVLPRKRPADLCHSVLPEAALALGQTAAAAAGGVAEGIVLGLVAILAGGGALALV